MRVLNATLSQGDSSMFASKRFDVPGNDQLDKDMEDYMRQSFDEAVKDSSGTGTATGTVDLDTNTEDGSKKKKRKSKREKAEAKKNKKMKKALDAKAEPCCNANCILF